MKDEKYFAPPWIKYPTCPKESSFWTDGSGAEYIVKYNEHVDDKDEYEKIFPKTITFKDGMDASDNFDENTINYLNSDSKPFFIKLWSRDGHAKYDPEYIENKYVIMYDDILIKNSTIYIGKNHYHSIDEVIKLVEDSIKSMDLTRDEYEKVWNEIKYTVYLNIVYYKLVDDINLVNEIIKTKDNVIACFSENLDFGLEKLDDGTLVGNNLMGLAMMEIRDELIESYKHYDDIDWEISGKPNSIKRCQCMAHNSNI